MLMWKCEQCGWESEKSGSEGNGEAMRHAKAGKREGVKHSCFLFDTDTKNPVLDNEGKVLKSLSKAQSLGLIPILKKAEEKEKGKISGSGQRQFMDITSRKPAPVLFTIGEHDIGLDPEPLYESYLLYEDLKVRYGFTDSFSVALKDAMVICYRLLGPEPKVKQEVKGG